MPSVTALAKSSASGPLAPIRPPQRVQISRPVSLIDDRWRKAVPDQQEIRRQPAYSLVASGAQNAVRRCAWAPAADQMLEFV
jgi:hypothetical protein